MNRCSTSRWTPAGAMILALLCAGAALAQSYTLDGFPDPLLPRTPPEEFKTVSFETPAPQASASQGQPSATSNQPRTIDLLRLQQQANFRNASQAASLKRTRRSQPPSSMRYGGKPFNHVSEPPVVSPYLSLDREEDEEFLPNYYTFVRPQLEQVNALQQQQIQLQRLESQVQGEKQTGGMEQGRGPISTGHGAYFMNTGSYFPR